MFGDDLYVRISRDLVRAKNVKSGKEAQVAPQAPFSTKRLLVGTFEPAQHALRLALRQVLGGGLFTISPNVLVHPLELVEGGLSQIEERVLRELAIGAGAKKVVVFTGPVLQDADVTAKLREG
jgi:rod shape-determining protein MreB and related proteins